MDNSLNLIYNHIFINKISVPKPFLLNAEVGILMFYNLQSVVDNSNIYNRSHLLYELLNIIITLITYIKSFIYIISVNASLNIILLCHIVFVNTIYYQIFITNAINISNAQTYIQKDMCKYLYILIKLHRGE